MVLSKSDRKAARLIIEKGLQQEYAKELNIFYEMLKKWKDGSVDNREAFHNLYASVNGFNKHIARRYDRHSSRYYTLIITSQLIDKVIDECDLKDLSSQTQDTIKRIVQLNNDSEED